MEPTHHILRLLQQYADGSLDNASRQELINYLSTAEEKQFHQLMESYEVVVQQIADAGPADPDLYGIIKERIDVLEEKPELARIIQFRWWVAASVALLLVSGTVWFFYSNQHNSTQLTNTDAGKSDILPGKEGAILTLADGSTITLDSTNTGLIATQNGSQILLQKGLLSYDPSGQAARDETYNTMSTPRGRQFQLVLPDGTKVWLNAASSITFPITFTNTYRKIQVSGEAYIEVAQNKSQPFLVDIDKKITVQVLGTNFNINSYKDDPKVITTLVQGSIKVINGIQHNVLLPGQQAVVARSMDQNNTQNQDRQFEKTVIQNADISQTLAWRNGVFNFQNLSFPEAAKQLERWYDIQIIYEGKIPDIQLQGDMDRAMQLSGIVRMLKALGINSKIEGRKLIIQ